jgi:hypothetical protein
MLVAEFDLSEVVSFWGGVASLVAIAITLISGLIALYRMLSRSTQAELERLEKAQKELGERTKAATTQGKRLDLFIYQESIFSHLRFRLIILEISFATVAIVGVMFLVFVFTLDRNADYAIDHLVPFLSNWRDHYLIIYSVSVGLVLFGMVDTSRRLRRERKRLNALSTTFISELGKIVEAKLPIEE